MVLRGKPWRRSGTSSYELPQEEWARFPLEPTGRSWDALPVDMSIQEAIDPARLHAFIRSAHAREHPRLSSGVRESDPVEVTLEKLGLLREGRPTNAALLLIGMDPQRLCPRARIRVFYFRDISDFDEYPECTGTIGEQIDAVMRTIAVANPARITFPASSAGEDLVERTKRHESVAYPDLALREAITNALVHRDYTVVGSEVEVKIYSDRLVIQNPGRLMPGLTTDELRQDPHPSRRRNPLIAEIAGLDYWIERAGTDTTRMIKLCEDEGLPTPEFEDRSSGFTVTFYRDPWTWEILAGVGLKERQVKGVMHVKVHGEIGVTGYQEVAQVSKSTAVRDLRDLEGRGILDKHGAGPCTHYILGKVPKVP